MYTTRCPEVQQVAEMRSLVLSLSRKAYDRKNMALANVYSDALSYDMAAYFEGCSPQERVAALKMVLHLTSSEFPSIFTDQQIRDLRNRRFELFERLACNSSR